MANKYIVYKDAEGRVKACYTNCDTTKPPDNCTREESFSFQKPNELYTISKPPTIFETLENKIRRIIKETQGVV